MPKPQITKFLAICFSLLLLTSSLAAAQKAPTFTQLTSRAQPKPTRTTSTPLV